MKVLLINGSPHREGNTFIALPEVARVPETPPTRLIRETDPEPETDFKEPKDFS